MMIEKYNARDLEIFLKKNKIADIKELKNRLGTTSRNTVLRKLNELSYKTSYSHNNSFYTLENICQFDDEGLWSHKEIFFSSFGNLLNTGSEFIERSESGMTVAELDECLHVSTKLALINLNRKGRLYREKHDGVFVYFSGVKKRQKRQIISRNEEIRGVFDNIEDDVLAHEMKAAIILFFTLLDEQQRRAFAGLESMKIGIGGDAKVAAILGLDPHTIAKGRKELLDGDFDFEKIRKTGGGRKSLEKKTQK